MAETIKVLSERAIAALKRDHEKLRYEVATLRSMLRAFMSQTEDRGLRPLCRFTLNSNLGTSNASIAATITHQYGYGREHASTSVSVYNLLTHTAGTYAFAGDSGDAGYAYYDPGTQHWIIIQMECP